MKSYSDFDVNQFETDFKNFLAKELPFNTEFNQSYYYSLFPAGKYFRPKLCWYLAQDLSNSHNQNIDFKSLFHLMAAIELHHCYTLIHDDLPAMDNDDFRRGRPTNHKEFNEWIAILTGDGLLNLSYRCLSFIQSKNLGNILKLFSKKLGPQGLILGQALDLTQDKNNHKINIDHILKIHELKTSRLIEVCSLGVIFLNEKITNYKLLVNMNRFGKSLGVLFQLLDDLLELTEQNFNPREKNINAFLVDNKLAINELNIKLKIIKKIIHQNKLNSTSKFIQNYLESNINQIKKGQQNLLALGFNISNINLIIKNCDLNSL